MLAGMCLNKRLLFAHIFGMYIVKKTCFATTQRALYYCCKCRDCVPCENHTLALKFGHNGRASVDVVINYFTAFLRQNCILFYVHWE